MNTSFDASFSFSCVTNSISLKLSMSVDSSSFFIGANLKRLSSEMLDQTVSARQE